MNWLICINGIKHHSQASILITDNDTFSPLLRAYVFSLVYTNIFIQDYTLEKLHSNRGALLWLVRTKMICTRGEMVVVNQVRALRFCQQLQV